MATRCRYPEHGNCATCGNYVASYACHSHEFDPRTNRAVILCGECADFIKLAAIPVIRAFQGSGIEATPRLISSMMARGHIAVLLQGELTLRLAERS